MLNAPATVTALTDEQCSPNPVLRSFDTYENTQSTGSALVTQGNKSWFFVTANEALGLSLEALTAAVVKKGGGDVKGALRYPFPDTRTSPASSQARASGAKVLGLANAGFYPQGRIKQPNEFGLNHTMKTAPLLMFMQDAHWLGPTSAPA